jgi:hypothetical protein
MLKMPSAVATPWVNAIHFHESEPARSYPGLNFPGFFKEQANVDHNG